MNNKISYDAQKNTACLKDFFPDEKKAVKQKDVKQFVFGEFHLNKVVGRKPLGYVNGEPLVNIK